MVMFKFLNFSCEKLSSKLCMPNAVPVVTFLLTIKDNQICIRIFPNKLVWLYFSLDEIFHFKSIKQIFN